VHLTAADERHEDLLERALPAGAAAQLVGFDEFNELVGLSAQRRRESALQDFAESLVAARASR
jgi:hypothetical protein